MIMGRRGMEFLNKMEAGKARIAVEVESRINDGIVSFVDRE